MPDREMTREELLSVYIERGERIRELEKELLQKEPGESKEVEGGDKELNNFYNEVKVAFQTGDMDRLYEKVGDLLSGDDSLSVGELDIGEEELLNQYTCDGCGIGIFQSFCRTCAEEFIKNNPKESVDGDVPVGESKDSSNKGKEEHQQNLTRKQREVHRKKLGEKFKEEMEGE